jgi:hypothetical protein
MEATIKPAGRRRIVTLATALFVIMIVGVAYAAWTATGTGTGFAEAGESGELGTAPATPLELLVPNTSADVEVSVTNDNPFAVELTDIVLDTTNNDGDITSDKTGCTPANNGVTFHPLTDIPAGTYIIPADSNGEPITLPDAVSMDETSHNSCQEAVFTIPVDLTGVSVAAN